MPGTGENELKGEETVAVLAQGSTATTGCDGVLDGEATVGTNREGHGSLAGRRMVGKCEQEAQERTR